MELKDFTTEERILTPYQHIDAGFINKRLCFSTFGNRFREVFEQFRRKGDDHWSELANNHLLVEMVLRACHDNEVKSLGEVLHDDKEHALFCSTEELEGVQGNVYEDARVTNRVLLPFEYGRDVVLEFGTEHFVNDTGKVEQGQNLKLAIVGGIHHIKENTVYLHPIIMGDPSYDHPLNNEFKIDLTWMGWDWYQIFPKDIKEFSKIVDVSEPSADEWMNVMKSLPEKNVKKFFCEILGDVPKEDWPGEQDDHFSSVHLGDEQVPTGFIFKGPGKGFKEMTPDMLGNRADQIYRLAGTPSRLLVVQHCHQIGEAVHETLKRFAVTPHDPRRYCLINGKDTYKIFKAYGKI